MPLKEMMPAWCVDQGYFNYLVRMSNGFSKVQIHWSNQLPTIGCCYRSSEEAAPSDVGHDGEEEEQAAAEGDEVDLHKVPHCLGNCRRQDQILPQDACSTAAACL